MIHQMQGIVRFAQIHLVLEWLRVAAVASVLLLWSRLTFPLFRPIDLWDQHLSQRMR
jgi:hypothetical protein